MKTSYVALLRGINVGGKNVIKMAELKPCLEDAGFDNVRTYIQSGNVLFESDQTNSKDLSNKMETAIKRQFGCDVGVVVITKERWGKIVRDAPKNWGIDTSWKHNLIVMLEPYNMDVVVAAIGTLKPDIEKIDVGDGVIYQSLSLEDFGKTTSGKLASNPIYKRMTVRNYNTAVKLQKLMEQ